jgi:putative ABC transport system ATP-binding protein
MSMRTGARRNVVEMERVAKRYLLGEHTVVALHEVSLAVEEGSFLAIAGPSGSGKSTLLNLIGCIDTPSSGQLRVAGHLINGRSADELALLRARNIGFVFQTFNLFPVLSAEENVEYPLLTLDELSRAERRERVGHFLNVVQLAKFARHRPNQLSGGQRQRVAIARALVTQPDIVLADEPTANLDHRTGEAILALMRDINRRFSTTFVFSTHDRKVIDAADRLVGIEDGRIRYTATRREDRWVPDRVPAPVSGARAAVGA